jgi:hypothetical protein
MFDSWTRLWTICGDPRSGGWPRAKISNIKQLDLSPGRVPEKSFSFYIHKPKGKINCDRKKKKKVPFACAEKQAEIRENCSKQANPASQLTTAAYRKEE